MCYCPYWRYGVIFTQDVFCLHSAYLIALTQDMLLPSHQDMILSIIRILYCFHPGYSIAFIQANILSSLGICYFLHSDVLLFSPGICYCLYSGYVFVNTLGLLLSLSCICYCLHPGCVIVFTGDVILSSPSICYRLVIGRKYIVLAPTFDLVW